MKTKYWITMFFTVLLLGSTLLSCAARPAIFVSRHSEGINLDSLAICPVQMAKPEEVQVHVGSQDPIPPTLFCLYGGTEQQDIITKMLEEAFIATGKLKIVPAAKTANALGSVIATNQLLSLAEAIRQTGKRLAVEAVLVCYLYNWQELDGAWYAAKRPASVAFEVHLYRVSDGKIIWRGIFDQTQGALTDDLLNIGKFIKRGGRWISASELARDGMEEITADILR